MTRTLLAVDGNSLLHRSFHASAASGFRTKDGRPMWAVRGLLSQVVAAVDRVGADAVVIGFDDRTASVRKDEWPEYKAQRLPKPPALDQQLDSVAEVLRGLGLHVVVPPGLEADDVLASAAAYAPTVGARTVVVTSDRDSFSLIDEHTRVLRILNGGVEASPLLDPTRLVQVAGVRPDQYLDYAALRGDASDNLPGVTGFGPKTAARLLAEFGSAEAAFDCADSGDERCQKSLGQGLTRTLRAEGARAAWLRNRAAMTMHTTAALGLDLAGGTGCLPLDEGAVRATFTTLQLFATLPVALDALAGRAPEPLSPPSEPDWYHPDVEPDHRGWDPTRPPRSAARFPPLPKPVLRAVQETLF